MRENEIFYVLLQEAEKVKDPEGAVAACLVRDGEIIAISPSAEDGIRHAEDLVIEMAQKFGIILDDKVFLMTTLEPCSYRNPRNGVDDCTTIILNAGIKRVVYAASDPNFSKEAKEKFRKSGIDYYQIQDDEIINQCIEVFNRSITKQTTVFGTERRLKHK